MTAPIGPERADAGGGDDPDELVIVDAGSKERDGSASRDAGAGDGATNEVDAGGANDPDERDSGVVVIGPPEPPAPETPFLEIECSAAEPCPDFPAALPEDNLCYSPDGSGSGTCMFYCTYHFVDDGVDKWFTPAGRRKTCESAGGECYPIGKNVYCLPKGTNPPCGDDPFCG